MIFLFVKDMKTLKTMSSSRELCENHPFAFWSTQQMLKSFSYLVTLQVSFICLVWLDLIHKFSNQKCKLNYYKLNKSAFCENFLKCNTLVECKNFGYRRLIAYNYIDDPNTRLVWFWMFKMCSVANGVVFEYMSRKGPVVG